MPDIIEYLFKVIGIGSACFHCSLLYQMQVSTIVKPLGMQAYACRANICAWSFYRRFREHLQTDFGMLNVIMTLRERGVSAHDVNDFTFQST